MRRGPSIRRLMLGVTILTLLVPIAVVAQLRLYHTYLVRETERGLISEAVVIGEAWRERWLEAQGIDPERAPRIQPPNAIDPVFFPYEPQLNLKEGPSLPLPSPSRRVTEKDSPAWAAGQGIKNLLKRVTLSNLSGASILDENGCVIVSTSDELATACLDYMPEVKSALEGSYTSAARLRVSRSPTPSLNSISRGGDIRVYIALPIFSDGKVVSVVHMARTSLTPLKGLWLARRGVLIALLASLLLTAAVTLYSAWTITRPVREITKAAQAIARGEPRHPFRPGGLVPAEVYTLSTALDTMTAQLSDRAAYISEFAANVSHELKTPLTGIGGAAELLREHGSEMSETERTRFLNNITDDVDRMKRLVTRLLQLARIQSAPAEAARIDVKAFFTDLIGRYGEQVRLDLTSAPEHIVMHSDHLESAVRNLVENAVRHGAGKPVDVTVASDHDRMLVKVKDRGTGISEGNRARIFDRFFTTERDRGGTGLGLSIVAAVAQTRGGSVTFDTGPEGTTFTLRL